MDRSVQLNDEVKVLRQVPMFAGIAPAKLKLLAYTVGPAVLSLR